MERTRILVWDLPLRLFHWSLAAAFVGAFLTAESERYRDVHVALGYTFFGLLAFRFLWGLIGTRYARFASFAFGPRAVLAYLRSLLTARPDHHLGHNPAGSWAIFALLGLGLATAATGYMTYEDVGGKWTEELHEGAANALLALVVVHVAGVIVGSLLHRENLVAAMLTGRKRGAPSEGIAGSRWATAVALASVVAVLWVAPISFTGLLPGGGTTPPGVSGEPVRHPAEHARHTEREHAG